MAGANRVLTMDLHAGQIQGFFNIPVDELTAQNLLARYFCADGLDDFTVVATDAGFAKKARNFAELLNAPLAIVEKRRIGNDGRREPGPDRHRRRTARADRGRRDRHGGHADPGGAGGARARRARCLRLRRCMASSPAPPSSGCAASEIKEMVLTDTVPLPEEKRLPNLTDALDGGALRGGHRAHPRGALGRRVLPAGGRVPGAVRVVAWFPCESVGRFASGVRRIAEGQCCMRRPRLCPCQRRLGALALWGYTGGVIAGYAIIARRTLAPGHPLASAPEPAPGGEVWPLVSIVLLVRDEVRNIRACVESLLASTIPRLSSSSCTMPPATRRRASWRRSRDACPRGPHASGPARLVAAGLGGQAARPGRRSH